MWAASEKVSATGDIRVGFPLQKSPGTRKAAMFLWDTDFSEMRKRLLSLLA